MDAVLCWCGGLGGGSGVSTALFQSPQRNDLDDRRICHDDGGDGDFIAAQTGVLNRRQTHHLQLILALQSQGLVRGWF